MPRIPELIEPFVFELNEDLEDCVSLMKMEIRYFTISCEFFCDLMIALKNAIKAPVKFCTQRL